MNSHPIIVQLWRESERGWGERPDGCSLHLTSEDQGKFIDEYWERQPDYVPDEYSFPADSYIVDVEESLYLKIKNSKNGIYSYDYIPKKNAKS